MNPDATATLALKERAVICERIASGEEILLLRKGGLADKNVGALDHGSVSFWLLPTYYHSRLEDLVPSARQRAVELQAPPGGTMHLDLHAEIVAAHFVTEVERLLAVAAEHCLSEECVRTRFAYREPGLWAFVLRARRLPAPHVVDHHPSYAGCVSWVTLSDGLSFAEAASVVPDRLFAERCAAVERGLGVEDPLAGASARILAHMNEDHVDAMTLYCRAFAGIEAASAHMLGIDQLGFEVAAKIAEATVRQRFEFPRAARTPAQARKLLVEMVAAARDRLSARRGD